MAGRTISASTAFPITSFNNIKVITSLLSSPSNYYSYSSRFVQFICIHYTGNSKDAAWNNANYFNTGSRGCSANYFTDETTCYQSVGLNNAAWAVGGTNVYKHPNCRNLNSISIEMCCSGNYTVSDKTITNTVYLCAALCEFLNISADEVDTFVLRHYDVWDKKCPAQWASNASSGWTAFKEKVKQILRNGSEELTMSQYEELKQMIADTNSELASLKATVQTIADYAGVKYSYIDKNLPEWAHSVMDKLLRCGAVQGDGDGFVMSESDIRLLTILDRIGVMDNNIAYKTIDDIPEWGRSSVQKLIAAGAILGESEDNLGLTMQVVKMIVFLDRAGYLQVQ